MFPTHASVVAVNDLNNSIVNSEFDCRRRNGPLAVVAAESATPLVSINKLLRCRGQSYSSGINTHEIFVTCSTNSTIMIYYNNNTRYIIIIIIYITFAIGQRRALITLQSLSPHSLSLSSL